MVRKRVTNVAKQPAKGRKTPAKAKKPAQTTKASIESASSPIDAIPAEVHPKPSSASTKANATASVPSIEKAATPSEPRVPETPASTPAPVAQNRTLPLVLGGLIAGVIGFAVANLTAPATDNTLSEQVAAQSASIASLEAQITNSSQIDLSAVEAAQTNLTENLGNLSRDLADVVSRLDTLEARPAGSAPNTTGVETEMDALRAQIAEMTGAAQTELEEARATAAAIEESAAAAARNAAGRAALARVQTSLESGAPIGAALGDLEAVLGESAPEALLAAQDGVPTLAGLQDLFPDAARAALATARSEGVAGEETTGFGAFLRNQLDVRSTTPQEGDGVDAILSRAEDAVRNGRLSDALAEVSALPEVSRAAMADWLAQAELRASAVAAVDILSSTLSDN